MKFSKLKGKLPPAEGAEPMAMEVEMEAPEAEMSEAPAKPAAALASVSDDELLAELERRKLLEGDSAVGPEPEMEA